MSKRVLQAADLLEERLKSRHNRTEDIIEFHIRAGKVYLSPIIDCFDGLVISWAISTKPDTDLANTMFDAALETIVDCDEQPIIHSDRGGHCRWPDWLERVNAIGLVRSML